MICRNILTPVFVLFFVSLSTEMYAQPGNRSPVYPDTSWMQYATPEEAGWSSEKIAEVKAYADSLGSDAVMLVYNGAIVTEWGHNTEVEFIASIYKSLFNALYGIAVEEGRIDTSSTIGELGIQAKPPLSETEKEAKVIHLLSASSGVYRMPEGRGPERGSSQPGERWYYNSWDFNALGTIYEEQTGEIIFKAIEQQIAEPTGMEDYDASWGHYFSQPWRSLHPSYNIWMSARDLARFGLLYLRDGQWNDKQVIPSSWVETSTKPRFRNILGDNIPAHWGLLWWIRGGEFARYDAYFASGVGSQSIWVLPELDIVFVHRASRDYNQGVYGLDVEKILLKLIEARTGTPAAQPELMPVQWGEE
ncbi:serine hydrolase domain-containing protein [Halalkalibaculum sp. DA3122]|uniref:serine hydrolase domain-containing protein n=1 Tax=Halalkalibaculum sp. DA3122 TaxID=3373607 RepID=UPI003754314C